MMAGVVGDPSLVGEEDVALAEEGVSRTRATFSVFIVKGSGM